MFVGMKVTCAAFIVEHKNSKVELFEKIVELFEKFESFMFCVLFELMFELMLELMFELMFEPFFELFSAYFLICCVEFVE